LRQVDSADGAGSGRRSASRLSAGRDEAARSCRRKRLDSGPTEPTGSTGYANDTAFEVWFHGVSTFSGKKTSFCRHIPETRGIPVGSAMF
jgi:hypothetical protein